MRNPLQLQAELRLQGEHLKKLREEREWTKKEVYSLLEIQAKTYDTWENGKTPISTRYLLDLSSLFEVSTDYLLGRTSDRNLGNAELSVYTGLSEMSIEVLRFLNSPVKDKEDEAQHKRIISLLNLIFENSYHDVINYRKAEADTGSITSPIDNLLTSISQYIDTRETELAFICDGERVSISGQFATITSEGNGTVYTVNELKRAVLIDRIKKQMNGLAPKEV